MPPGRRLGDPWVTRGSLLGRLALGPLFSTEIQKGGVGAKIAGIGEAKPYRGLTQMNADQDKGGGQSEAPKRKTREICIFGDKREPAELFAEYAAGRILKSYEV